MQVLPIFGFCLLHSRANVPFPVPFLSSLSSPHPVLQELPISMALAKAPSSSNTHPNRRLDVHSIHSLISLVNLHLHHLLSDPTARSSLYLKCRHRLSTPRRGHFEFSENSVLSSLYWGIESVEAAIRSCSAEERAAQLAGSEKMLQAPALLEEDGSTAGVENRCLVCCSYFYLSLVKKLQRDQWQMTTHLLQSVLVFPGLVRTELAPAMWVELFGPQAPPLAAGSDEAIDKAVREQGRRYKDWLMYYQVITYGETPHWNKDSLRVGNCDIESYNHQHMQFQGTRLGSSLTPKRPDLHNDRKVCSVHCEEHNKATTYNLGGCEGFTELKDGHSLLKNSEGHFLEETKESLDIRCLQDMLEESQSDSPALYVDVDSTEASDSEVMVHDKGRSAKVMPINEDILAFKHTDRKCLNQCSSHKSMMIFAPESPKQQVHAEDHESKTSYLLPSRSHGSLSNLACYVKGECHQESSRHRLRCFSSLSSTFMKKCNISEFVSQDSFARKIINFRISEKAWNDGSSNYEKDAQIELLESFQKAVLNIFSLEGTESCVKAGSEVTTIWESLNNKTELRFSLLKHDIFDQLWDCISTSTKENVIRSSVYILLLLISEDRTIIEVIKRKNLHLQSLAGALKRNVHEAAVLIYLLDPSPSEIKGLELLPALVEVACNSNCRACALLPVSPASASISMIEVLVTAFDYVTNNINLATVSSPQVLSKLMNVAMNGNLEEGVALADILVRCMRLNGNCKKFLSQATPLDPFLFLLRRNEKRAKFAAIEYFHEILQMPRSSAIHLLQMIRREGGISIMHTLTACIQTVELEHRLLAANLLLQLVVLEKSNYRSAFKQEAIDVILESVASEENTSMQELAAFILSTHGGTYSWSGEPYTIACLVKKAGLTSTAHKNMIRNIEWLNPCLQDSETSRWSNRMARAIIGEGTRVFAALAKGMQSKSKSVSHDCLVCIAWLGSEMAVDGREAIRYAACEILLSDIAQFLHPGSELDERILACLCVYNYTLGKGKQKLMNFSDGSRESLRRLSAITWMAQELHQVTDYFLPTKLRVSCVHTQTLELGQAGNAAVTAIAFFKGQLYAGYSDGTIKAWDTRGQTAMLAMEVKEHKKAVTCFALFEPGDNLLSGSSDKSIRVWRMVQRKLECIEVMQMKEPVQKLETCGDKIVIITQNQALKVSQSSRRIQTICKNKHAKCIAVTQGKVYLGGTDSSIQEVDMIGGNKIEIRPPIKSWKIRKHSVNSIVVYKDWMYCAGAGVEGSSLKDWRRRIGPKVSIPMAKGEDVHAMAVVEDFIYMNCSRYPSIIQIWLREKQQKVGRLSAGSKIASILTANDTIFCGTENGLIKAWIPLQRTEEKSQKEG